MCRHSIFLSWVMCHESWLMSQCMRSRCSSISIMSTIFTASRDGVALNLLCHESWVMSQGHDSWVSACATGACYNYLYCVTVSKDSVHYGVASVSRIHKIIGLFCKRALSQKNSAKESHNLINPTNRRHPIFPLSLEIDNHIFVLKYLKYPLSWLSLEIGTHVSLSLETLIYF